MPNGPRNQLFHPVGMTTTTAYIERARGGEFAYPYTVNRAGEYERAPVKVEAQMHAAGGMASSVQDLLRWVRLNLSGGQLDGKQVIPAHVVRQVHAPQIQFDWTFYKFRRYAYGLGVHNSDYEGDLLIHHFGGPIHVSFMPEHDLGRDHLFTVQLSTAEVEADPAQQVLNRRRHSASRMHLRFHFYWCAFVLSGTVNRVWIRELATSCAFDIGGGCRHADRMKQFFFQQVTPGLL